MHLMCIDKVFHGDIAGNRKERSNSPTLTVLDSPLLSSTDVQDYEQVATRSVPADRGSKITEEADNIAKKLERQMLIERIGNSENGSISSSSNETSTAVRMRRNVPAKLSKPLKSTEEAVVNSKGFRDARGSVIRNASQVTTDVREMEDLEAVQFTQDTVKLDIKDELRNVRRQMSSGDTAGARKVLQKVGIPLNSKLIYNSHGDVLDCSHLKWHLTVLITSR